MVGTEVTVGGWFALVGINKLADFIKAYLENNWELHDQTKQMMHRLVTNLVLIKAAIERLEMRRIMIDDGLAEWLRQLKDVVYEADDLLDDLESTPMLGEKKGNNKVSDRLRHFLETVNVLTLSDPIVKNLKIVVEKSDRLANNIPNSLSTPSKEGEQGNVRRDTSSLTCDRISLFGRDRNINDILGKLIDASKGRSCLNVIPILGVGGVGKTALAQQIYNHVDTSEEYKFDVRLWVCVSNNDDMKSIAIQMLKALKVPEEVVRHLTTLQAIHEMLKVSLKNKKFLIVLDDLWDERSIIWEDLCPPLTFGAKGSVVLVTTQSRITAARMGTTGFEPVILNLLEDDDFQSLCEYYAFGDKKKFIDATLLKDLQSIGRQIAKKLPRLPLMGKELGGLLRSNLNKSYWEKVLESEWSKVLESILPSLGLSFQYLSPNLKQCFAYCSLFPQGYIIKKESLVQMWMAQGYIQPDKRMRKRLEDIGIELFDELIDKSFFHPTRENWFVVDDLMRVLAVSVSSHECFVFEDYSKGVPPSTRHLSLRTDGLNVLDCNIPTLEGLRTLMFFGDYDSDEFSKALTSLFEKSRSLRVLDLSCKSVKGRTLPAVLDLSCKSMKVKTLPDSINGLSHLRYLDLSCNKFEELPRTFNGLFLLQVLNLQGCQFDKLPGGINKLSKLRHLYANGDTLSLIAGIGRLTCLQELVEFRVKSAKGHQITELKDMNGLQGSLRITDLKLVPSMEQAMGAALKLKAYIHSLQLIWDSCVLTGNGGNATENEQNRAEEVLEALQPNDNLKELLISKYNGVTSPTWMVNQCLSNLQSLTLDSCNSWKILPTLGQLQKLKVLHIKDMGSIKQIDDQLYGNHLSGERIVFPSLEELILECMYECVEWLDVEEGFLLSPRLRKLHIISCRKLNSLPLSSFGDLIVELVIRDCCDLCWAPQQCVRKLTSLRILEISLHKHKSCLDLRSLKALQQLRLVDCPEITLVNGQDSLTHLTSLELLQIRGCPNVLLDEEDLPAARHADHSLGLLTHLAVDIKFLRGHGFLATCKFPKLTTLEISGAEGDHSVTIMQKPWFLCLKELQLHASHSLCLDMLPPSLEKFALSHCPSINSLPVMGHLPASLKELHIISCPQLKEQYEKRGADWTRIAHIPCIRIVEETACSDAPRGEVAPSYLLNIEA